MPLFGARLSRVAYKETPWISGAGLEGAVMRLTLSRHRFRGCAGALQSPPIPAADRGPSRGRGRRRARRVGGREAPRVQRTASDGMAWTAATPRPGSAYGRPPSRQNARLRAGIKVPRPHRERDRMAPVSRSAAPRQFPFRPYNPRQFPLRPYSRKQIGPANAGPKRENRKLKI